MLKIILNRLKPQVEKIIAEEHQHQKDLYSVFIDFKKAFDRAWHAALWATMKKYNAKPSKTSITRPLVPSFSTAA